jgi:hypothetical protein
MSENGKNIPKSSEPKKNSIKYGIIYQNSDIIHIKDYFNSYFEKEKPNIIKNTDKGFEFSRVDENNNNNNNNTKVFCFSVLTESDMKKIYDLYNYFNFFLIFIDIQSNEDLTYLESIIDKLIDCSEDNTKKCYIFGFFNNENKSINKDEQITNILNCKGIDYEYSEININSNEEFPKGIEYIIEDSKEIMEEIEIQEVNNKRDKNQAKSCQII